MSLAHLRHELLTHVNHVLGFTEMQLDEGSESRLSVYMPMFADVHARGRNLLAIIERELDAGRSCADLVELDRCLSSEARPALDQAQRLAYQLHAAGLACAAEEMDLVSTALERLLETSRGMVPI